MSSLLHQIATLPPLDKIDVIARRIDQMEHGQFQAKLTLEDQTRTLDLATLAQEYGITPTLLAEKINKTLGDKSAHRIGKKRVIREIRWLDYLKKLEEDQ